MAGEATEQAETSGHWADHAAARLIEKYPNRNQYVCASGISPSGVVHIGNFREVITVDFVVRALKARGKEVRFLYSWDDYDALRKVPAGLPNQKLIAENLRRPIGKIPDPFGTEATYARHFERQFEAEIARLGIAPQFIYQHQAYESGTYRDGIVTALENEAHIRQILNRARTEDLSDNWRCVTLYCKSCGRDTTEILSRKGLAFRYRCGTCDREDTLDGEHEPGLKLLWRVDWPMRWAHEGVDFEPGGKDHSSTGGSFETGAAIVREIYHRDPPVYVQYDFVLAKGLGSKLSSSSGNLITLSQALEVYEPAVIRWIFASRKPNIDFSISFDLDVMKAYDDFDRCERIALGTLPAEPKKFTYESRIYDLSLVSRGVRAGRTARQFPFRHLCNVLQIYGGDIAKAARHHGVTAEEQECFYERASRAWRWITEYAPSDFRFSLKNKDFTKSPHPALIGEVIALLEKPGMAAEKEDFLSSSLFEIAGRHGLPPKAMFETLYEALIGKKQGPKLASFLLTISPEKAVEILKKAV